MQETVNPSRAAKQIGIPGSTLRLWAKTYAEFLSPGANPPVGTERRFTAADLEILKAVNQLRHNGLLPVDIVQRLRINAATGQQSAPETPPSPLAVQNDLAPSHDAIQRFLQGTEVRDKLTDVDRRLERLEQRHNTLWLVLAGFAAGVLLVAVVVWLVLAFMR